MNILQINTVDFRGGAAQVAYNLKLHFEKQGHKISFFVSQKTTTQKNVFLSNPRINFGNISKISKKYFKKDIPSFFIFKSRDIFRSLIANDIEYFNCNIIDSEEFREADIIHCHNLHGNYFNLKLLEIISREKPVIWTLHDMWAFTGHCSYSYTCNRWKTGCGSCPDLKIYPALFWDNTAALLKKKAGIYNNSSLHIVTPSHWLMGKAKKSVLNGQRFSVIPNGINIKDLKKHDKINVRRELGLPLNKKIIMFLAAGGRKDKRKGWWFIEDIRKKLGDVIFLCIGNKDKQESDPNTVYKQYIDSKTELAKYFSASDVFLFTSLAENFPLVILEAMACGTPIVSFDVGGVKEAMIHKENGYIAKYKDKDDLINGIDYILSLSENELHAMSQKSRERVEENYSLKIMANQYLDLYKKVLINE